MKGPMVVHHDAACSRQMVGSDVLTGRLRRRGRDAGSWTRVEFAAQFVFEVLTTCRGIGERYFDGS